jgi:hypothetical protein
MGSFARSGGVEAHNCHESLRNQRVASYGIKARDPSGSRTLGKIIARRKAAAIKALRRDGFVIVRKPYAWLNMIEPHLCPPIRSKREMRRLMRAAKPLE